MVCSCLGYNRWEILQGGNLHETQYFDRSANTKMPVALSWPAVTMPDTCWVPGVSEHSDVETLAYILLLHGEYVPALSAQFQHYNLRMHCRKSDQVKGHISAV